MIFFINLYKLFSYLISDISFSDLIYVIEIKKIKTWSELCNNVLFDCSLFLFSISIDITWVLEKNIRRLIRWRIWAQLWSNISVSFNGTKCLYTCITMTEWKMIMLWSLKSIYFNIDAYSIWNSGYEIELFLLV